MATANDVKKMWEANKDYVAHQFAQSLQKFGYSSIANDWVKAEIERLYTGGEAKAGPSMFIARWLKDGVE